MGPTPPHGRRHRRHHDPAAPSGPESDRPRPSTPLLATPPVTPPHTPSEHAATHDADLHGDRLVADTTAGGNAAVAPAATMPEPLGDPERRSTPVRQLQPLHHAALVGDLAQVQALVAAGADVNAKNERGFTPVLCACVGGRCDIIRFLVNQAGADIHAANTRGVTPLLAAARWGHTDAVDLLFLCGADADAARADAQGTTPLHEAAAGGHLAMAVKLCGLGAPVNCVTAQGVTPLNLAAERGYVELAQYLLTEGADVDLADCKTGDTALHRAARAGEFSMVRLLLQHRAQPQARNAEGLRAIDVATDPTVRAILAAARPYVPPLERLCLSAARLHWGRYSEAVRDSLPSPLFHALEH